MGDGEARSPAGASQALRQEEGKFSTSLGADKVSVSLFSALTHLTHMPAASGLLKNICDRFKRSIGPGI